MMAATDTRNLTDQMTKLRLKLMQRKLENERENAPSTATQVDPANSPDALQRALERRQDLLNRLRDEKLNESRTPSPMYRPRSYGGHRHRRLLTPIRTARSLPDIQVYRPNEPMPHRQIVEHQITSQIPPPAHPPPPQPQPVVQPIVNQMPQPIVNQVPQPIVNQIPPQNPLIHNVYPPAPPETRNSAFLNRNDMVDMMMMQNAQMHQIVMQQMMFQHLPMKQGLPQQQVSMPVQVMQEPPAPVVVQAPGGGKRPPSVHHHHHYSSVQQQPAVQYQAAPQPVVSHITQLPPLQPRRVYRNIPPPPPPSATQTVGPDFQQPQTDYYDDAF